MRKHPVAFGIFLLFLVGMVFFLLVYVLGSTTEDKHSFTLNNKVGIVKVEGVIGDTRDVIEQLNQFGKDEGIKAVILRIDSPGGGVASSQEIYEAVIDIKKKKKLWPPWGLLQHQVVIWLHALQIKLLPTPALLPEAYLQLCTSPMQKNS
jgi:protease-4